MEEWFERYRLVVFLGFFAVMFLIEGVMPSRRGGSPRWKRLSLNGSLALFNTVLMKALKVGPLLVISDWAYSNNLGLASQLTSSLWVEVALSLVVLDLFDYWWHRWSHEVPWLWRFHKVHHADTEVDVSTSLRFHPGELIISFFVKAVWILVWGPSAFAFVIFEIGISMASQFHHSNIDLGRADRWVRQVFVTPRFHASHHTLNERTREGNYSTIFSFWDYLFASWRPPELAEFKKFGLPGGESANRSLWVNLKAPFSSKTF